MAKLLVITSYVQNFHNYRDGIDERFHEIFSEQFDCIDETEDFSSLTLERLRGYDCVALYCAATWGLTGTDSFPIALTRYLAGGGRILLNHIVSLGRFPEGAQLYGGAFRMHPPYQPYTFYPTQAGRELMSGFESFTIGDEAHLLFTERLLDKEILLYAVDNDHKAYPACATPHQDIYAQSSGIKVPLAWRLRFCKGKMIYCCPGHYAASFAEPGLQSFLRGCAKWLLEA